MKVKLESESKRVGKRPPLWLRLLLMTALVLAAALAFYLNNLKIIEHLENR